MRKWQMIVLGVAAAAVLGCVAQHEGADFQPNNTISHPDPVGALVLKLGLISWICLLVGIGGIIASYVGPIAAFVPRKAAAIAFAVGLGLAFVQAWIQSLGEHIFWITTGLTLLAIAGVVVALWPFILAWRNKLAGRLAPHAAAAADTASVAAVSSPASEGVKP